MINIRIMQIDDYDSIIRLWKEKGQVALNSIDDSFEGLLKYLSRNPATSFVATDNGRIIGTIMAGHDGRRGFFHHVYISDEYRGQGIGKMLVESAIDALTAEGIGKTALVVFSDNDLGNTFWEHMGFTVRDDLVYRNKVIR